MPALQPGALSLALPPSPRTQPLPISLYDFIVLLLQTGALNLSTVSGLEPRLKAQILAGPSSLCQKPCTGWGG